MNILHTSDWHLGRALYGKKRHNEFAAFLNWMISEINRYNIRVLLVSGDIFDTTAPGSTAQELYYDFLCQVSQTCCRHVVITAGNHDSPSFLSAPKDLLKVLNVHIASSIHKKPSDDVLVLYNEQTIPELIVCAIPYIRDREIRMAEPGETIEDKNRKVLEGIKHHYEEVCTHAHELKIQHNVPVVVMGHLFAAGGVTLDGDGVRELYVGTLTRVGTDIFPEYADYCALGHLHVPQKVAQNEYIRYSGSPIPMGFSEAQQNKTVIVFNTELRQVTEISVPCFQKLSTVSGDREQIFEILNNLKNTGESIWVEIVYTGELPFGNLDEELIELTEQSSITILRIKNMRAAQAVLNSEVHETLDDIDEFTVLNKRLDAAKITDEDERKKLSILYQEILIQIQQKDLSAELPEEKNHENS